VDDDTHWETLLHAGRRRKIGLNDLIERVRDKRMTVGQRNGESGFHGIVVPKSEVEAITPKPGTIHGTASEELRGMAAAAFRQSIGLRDGGVFQALIEAGHVSARGSSTLARSGSNTGWSQRKGMCGFLIVIWFQQKPSLNFLSAILRHPNRRVVLMSPSVDTFLGQVLAVRSGWGQEAKRK
jgi:hypothetical protein